MTAQLPFSGMMDMDSPETSFPAANHRYARNIRFRTKGNVRPENIPGARLVENELPEGANECIGAYYDELKQRVFFLNWNSEGHNGIYLFDRVTGTVTPLLISFEQSAADLFGFDPAYPAASINILYTTEEDGDLLHWLVRNQRPQKLNIKDALTNRYGTNWKAEYLTVARRMPLLPPKCRYVDDSTVHLNNQRSKLWQFRYRWIYTDNTASAYSPYSKLFTPVNPEDLSTDTNETKNNRIDVAIKTGPADVVKIEVAARLLLEGNVFSDDMTVETLDKVKLLIGNESDYTYLFYNDGAYPYAQLKQSTQLFDYVPKRANAQELLNGDVLIYGGITEGNTYTELTDVSSEVVTAAIETGIPMVITGTELGRAYRFIFSGIPQTGDITGLRVRSDDDGDEKDASYTVAPGDTLTIIRDFYVSYFNGLPGYTAVAVTDISGNVGVRISRGLFSLTGDYVLSYATPPTTVSDIGTAAYRPNSKLAFGLVYFDEYGVTNGVVRTDSMTVKTNEVVETGTTQPSISTIRFTVNSQPPIWAKSFSWVRASNLTASDSFFMVSANSNKDSKYGYLDITNLQTNQDNIRTYDWKRGDRIRIFGKYLTTSTGVKDYPLLALVQDPTINDTVKPGAWVKFPYDAVTMSDFGATGFEHYYVEIYSPTENIGLNVAAYYEIGESYSVLNPGTSTRAHSANVQNQVAVTTPAIFNFGQGDYYVRKREVALTANLATTAEIWIFDRSISDKYTSKTDGKGRAFVIDPYARETYKPTLVRYSLAYQQGTDINETNRFYPQNYDEYDRQRGDIQRMKVRGRSLRIFQARACGNVPIYQQVLSNADGTTNLLQSDQIINSIQYYQGEYGMGKQYCCLASSAGADYFSDPVRGCQVRLAGDGLSPVSEYGMKYELQRRLTAYLKDYPTTNGRLAKLIGVFDYGENEFLTIMQGATSVQPPSDLTYTDTTTINGYYIYLHGTPVPGYEVYIVLTGTGVPTIALEYMIAEGDTLTTIVDALMSQVSSHGGTYSAVPAAFGDSPGTRIQGMNGGTTGNTTIAFLPQTLLSADAISFNETRNGYTSFLDYYVDWLVCAENTLISWQSGRLYVHDSEVHGQFHGINYPAYIDRIVSDPTKKEYLAIGYHSNTVWHCPELVTSEGQVSNLVIPDFVRSEGQWNAAIGRDVFSVGGWINGHYLIGQWMRFRLQNSSISSEFLHHLYLNYKASQRTF